MNRKYIGLKLRQFRLKLDQKYDWWQSLLLIVPALLLIYWLASGDSDAPTNNVITFKTYPATITESVRPVIAAFVRHCPGVAGDVGDITSATARLVDPAVSYGSNKRGWKTEVVVQLKISGEPSGDVSYAAGHTLTFELGAGDQPGIYTHKSQEQQICGLQPASSGSNQMIPVPALDQMAILKSLTPYRDRLKAAMAEVNAEKQVKSAAWLDDDPPSLMAGVIDDGTDRGGFAEYLCLILTKNNLHDGVVRVMDQNSAVRTNWREIGKAWCP